MSRRYYDPGRQPQPRRVAPKKPGRNDLTSAAWLRQHEAELRDAKERERLAALNTGETRQQRRKRDRESRKRLPNGLGDMVP